MCDRLARGPAGLPQISSCRVAQLGTYAEPCLLPAGEEKLGGLRKGEAKCVHCSGRRAEHVSSRERTEVISWVPYDQELRGVSRGLCRMQPDAASPDTHPGGHKSPLPWAQGPLLSLGHTQWWEHVSILQEPARKPPRAGTPFPLPQGATAEASCPGFRRTCTFLMLMTKPYIFTRESVGNSQQG